MFPQTLHNLKPLSQPVEAPVTLSVLQHGHAVCPDVDDDEDSSSKKRNEAGNGSSKAKGKAAAASNKKPPLSRHAAFKQKLSKQLFGWMDPK